MKQKLTSTILALALALSLSLPTYAACACPTQSICVGELLQQLLRRCEGDCNGTAQPDWSALLQIRPAQKPAAPTETPAETEQPEQPSAEPEQPHPPEQPEGAEQNAVTETPAAGSSVRAYEREVVRLVNEERAKYGLAALTEDESLSDLARLKSRDMRDNGYFDHNSPTYGTPFQMMKSFGFPYRTAGENIAMGYATPEAVVSAWMNSSGHRANILNASYTHIGVGYVAEGNYWTQAFIG